MTSRYFPIRLIPDKPSVNFMGKHRVAFTISLILSLASIALFFTKGLNYGIDFTGGIVIETRFEQAPDIATIRTLLSHHIPGEVALQHFGSDRDVMIRIQYKEGSDVNQSVLVQSVKSLLGEHIAPNIEYRKVDFVGPQVSDELLFSGALSLILAFLSILVYIWFRFEWQFGVGAIIALLHDAIMTIGFYSITGIEFNLTSVAALLTIIGYSINDSVVIYDRIRENLRKYKKKPLEELLNMSINETLSRTLMTVATTLFSILALILLGGDVIRTFSIAMFFGIAVGTYSSIYVSAPILIYMNMRKNTAE